MHKVYQTEEGSHSRNWNESRDVASLPFSHPPCTLQGMAVTGGEETVHQRGNWPWFIGGQSSQWELAQHWHRARQGHAVNISRPTQPSPNPPQPGHHYSRSAVTVQEGSRVCVSACSCVCARISRLVCLCVCVQWVTRVRRAHTKTCHKKWQAVSLNWRKKPLSSSSINSCWQSLCKDS